MGWQERDYRDKGGGESAWRRAFRRVFVEGDSFFAWSFPLFTISGIRVKIHLVFVLIIIAFLIQSIIRPNVIGTLYMAISMGLLFTIVLLHEFGHCFACRRVGGEADEILLWPLGGLASCLPPHDWKSRLITTVGGPAVNVALFPITAIVLLAIGEPGAIFYNPLKPESVLAGFTAVGEYATLIVYAKAVLWLAHHINLLILAFNVLLPMFPMDGGRMLQEIMWRKIGYERSMFIACNVGLFAAVVVGVFGAVVNLPILIMIAVFAGFTCWQERTRARFLDEGYGPQPDISASLRPEEPIKERAPAKRDLRRVERERQEQEELDRTLAKISQTGIDSLTRAERKTLKRATERQQGN